jgi:hypothetical protein
MAPPLARGTWSPRRAGQFAQLVQIGQPAVADGFGDQGSSGRGCRLASQRRWVTPLVLLLNFSGHNS